VFCRQVEVLTAGRLQRLIAASQEKKGGMFMNNGQDGSKEAKYARKREQQSVQKSQGNANQDVPVSPSLDT
jgi:hypothetical protein